MTTAAASMAETEAETHQQEQLELGGGDIGHEVNWQTGYKSEEALGVARGSAQGGATGGPRRGDVASVAPVGGGARATTGGARYQRGGGVFPTPAAGGGDIRDAHPSGGGRAAAAPGPRCPTLLTRGSTAGQGWTREAGGGQGQRRAAGPRARGRAWPVLARGGPREAPAAAGRGVGRAPAGGARKAPSRASAGLSGCPYV